MDIVLLVKLIAGLSAILFVLLLFFIYSHRNRSKTQEKKKSSTRPILEKSEYDWNTLLKVIRNRQSTTQELQETLTLILKYHGTIAHKLGIRVNPEFDKYSEVIFRLCRHPNTTKDLIIDFDKELEKRNPEYIKEINDTLIKGLNSRGV